MTISSFGYKYDNTANRRRVVEATGAVVTWGYDRTYQLLEEVRSVSNPYAITYTYDPVGNRLTQRNSGTPTTYTYNAANELTVAKSPTGPTTYGYDANGNTLRELDPGDVPTTYTWDYENRMTVAQINTGVTDDFAYNADSQRVQRVDTALALPTSCGIDRTFCSRLPPRGH